MNCSYCFQHNNEKYNPQQFSDFSNLLKFLRTLDFEERVIVTFCGGELTLKPELIEQCENEVFKKIERERDVKFEYAIITNGTNIEVMFDLFDKRILNYNFCNVSWDGLYSSSLSRHISGKFNDEYFKEMIKKIGNSEYNNLSVVHALTPSTIEYLSDSFKFMIDNGITSFGYYPIHEANYTEDFCKKFEKELEKIYHYISGKDLNFFNIEMMNCEQNEYYFTCTKLGHNYYINTSGDIYPCIYFGDHNAYLLGNIKNGLDEDAKNRFINDYLQYPDCGYENCKCKFCGECNAACYVNNGNMNKKFKNLCEIRKIEQRLYDKYKDNLILFDSYNDEDVNKNRLKLQFKKCDIEPLVNMIKQPHFETLRNWK